MVDVRCVWEWRKGVCGSSENVCGYGEERGGRKLCVRAGLGDGRRALPEVCVHKYR